MKFIVTRTSQWGDENPPCEEAKHDSIVYVETYACLSPEEFNRKFAKRNGEWLSVGTNHRVNEKGYIARDRGTKNVWLVEFNTLDELTKFCDKYGDLVIQDYMWNEAYKEIEIYDDYRE